MDEQSTHRWGRKRKQRAALSALLTSPVTHCGARGDDFGWIISNRLVLIEWSQVTNIYFKHMFFQNVDKKIIFTEFNHYNILKYSLIFCLFIDCFKLKTSIYSVYITVFDKLMLISNMFAHSNWNFIPTKHSSPTLCSPPCNQPIPANVLLPGASVTYKQCYNNQQQGTYTVSPLSRPSLLLRKGAKDERGRRGQYCCRYYTLIIYGCRDTRVQNVVAVRNIVFSYHISELVFLCCYGYGNIYVIKLLDCVIVVYRIGFIAIDLFSLKNILIF